MHHFNPRAPCGARRSSRPARRSAPWYFNPRAPCGARQQTRMYTSAAGYFNPRAPCGARRQRSLVLASATLFQPTRPLRGATMDHPYISVSCVISTHAPLAGRDAVDPSHRRTSKFISTHAPLAGRDSKSVQITMHIFAITDKFQMLLHRMPPVRAFCSFLMQENHADFGCEPPK